MCLPSVRLCACVSVHVNMRKHVSELVFGCVCECSSGRVFGYVLNPPWQAGTKADMISHVSVKAGAAIQSFMSPHNTSRLPVNRLACRSSSTVQWQTKYFATSVSVLTRMRTLSPLKPSCDWITFLPRIWISTQLNESNVSHSEECHFSSRAITKLCIMFNIISGDWWGVEGV